ncbi:MAG: restriction endonuclease, partial [Candidatus Thorarchaeota archaeon]|nr:restriction endonuclease [Candidatus Thorarchaeota archaeon]
SINTGLDKTLNPKQDWDLEFWLFQWRWLYLEMKRPDLAIATLEELADTIWDSLETGLVPESTSLLTSLGLLHLEINNEKESKLRLLQALTIAVRQGEDAISSSPWIALQNNFDVTQEHLSSFLDVIRKNPDSNISSLSQKLKRISTYVDLQVFFDSIVDVDKPAIDKILTKIKQSNLSPPKRGLMFEQMSRDLLEAVEGFEVISLRTKTGQLDGVVTNHRTDHPFFLELGHYFLMEAKNWKKPVSSSAIRSFLDKMREHNCHFGIIISTSGVSGPDGENAKGRIQSAFHEGYSILVLDESDLKDIISCQNILQILRKKYEDLKFQS